MFVEVKNSSRLSSEEILDCGTVARVKYLRRGFTAGAKAYVSLFFTKEAACLQNTLFTKIVSNALAEH